MRTRMIVLSLASLLYWVALFWAVMRTRRGVECVPDAPALARWPRVSVIVPARDEAAHVGVALRSKLEDRYAALEVVFVDDRSTDDTRAIAEALAQQDARLRVVHVDALPEGWLGKLYAMQRGLEASTGEWVLFSDADVRLAPDALARVVAYAEGAQLDHVTLFPHVEARGALLAPTLAAFHRVVLLGGRLWRVSDPRSSVGAGVGAFNLVRRAALERTQGLAWLKMEIADDMALGVMLKRAGARSAVRNGRDLVRLEFYPSFRELVRAVEKNGAAAPFLVQLVANVALVALEAGFAVGPAPLAAATLLVAAVSSALAARWCRLAWWPALAPPVGMLLLSAAMIRSAFLALVRGGVLWRGTKYPTAVVRSGQRLRLSS